MYEILSHADWSPVLNATTVDNTCNAFYDIIYSVFDQCVPLHTSRRSKRCYPPWFTGTIIRNLRNKFSAHKKYKRYKTCFYYDQFKHYRALCKTLIENAYKDYVADMQDKLFQDSTKFWSYVNGKRNRTRIPGSMKYNDMQFNTPKEVMDAFADYFSSVYTPAIEHGYEPSTDKIFPSCNLNVTLITEGEVLAALKKCKNSFLNGPDLVPSFLIRDCAAAFVKPLHHLFNVILKQSQFPDIWKVAQICPILKSGDVTDVANYRPISILSNFSKAFESILYTQIYGQLRSIFSSNQHGFIPGRSTITNLSCFSQYISESLDRGGQVDVVYTDFQKAFDQVDHYVLLTKLANIGFSATLCTLFKSYLECRQHFVKYSGVASKTYISTSGIAQGSNLGPILFLVFINDIVNSIQCETLLYADDLKIFTKINSKTDCYRLQNDLLAIDEWCHRNRLRMNVNKCKVVTFTRKQHVIEVDYVLQGSVLERCSIVKDLGITFDSTLTFSHHVKQMVSAAYRTYGFIYRNCRDFSNVNCLLLLYNSHIRTRLEYGAMIWYPIYQIHINTVESVQRRCLKFLMFVSDRVYPERGYDYSLMLSRFNVESLQLRRKMISIKFLFNLLHNKIDCSMLLDRLYFNVPRITARHEQTFFISTPRTNILFRSPIYIMCSNYNSICDSVDLNIDSLPHILSYIT